MVKRKTLYVTSFLKQKSLNFSISLKVKSLILLAMINVGFPYFRNFTRFVFQFLTRKRTTDPSFTASGTFRGFPPSEAVTLTGVEDNDTSTRVNVARTTSYDPGTGILILSSGTGNYFEIDAEMPT